MTSEEITIIKAYLIKDKVGVARSASARSKTFHGIALAMVSQWYPFLIA